MMYKAFLKEIAPYVVVVGSFGRMAEGETSDIDCFLRSRPVEEVDPEIGTDETYMPEILDIVKDYDLEWSSVIIGHIAVEQQPGIPRMIEISSHYRIPAENTLFYRDVEGIQMLCAEDDKTWKLENTYDRLLWDDDICDLVNKYPLPSYDPPVPALAARIDNAQIRAAEDKHAPFSGPAAPQR